MGTRKLLSLLGAAALLTFSGCATDDAVQKDAKNAQPTVEKGADQAGKAADTAVDAVDDNDSK